MCAGQALARVSHAHQGLCPQNTGSVCVDHDLTTNALDHTPDSVFDFAVSREFMGKAGQDHELPDMVGYALQTEALSTGCTLFS